MRRKWLLLVIVAVILIVGYLYPDVLGFCKAREEIKIADFYSEEANLFLPLHPYNTELNETISIYQINSDNEYVQSIRSNEKKGGYLYIKDRFSILGNKVSLALKFEDENLTRATIHFEIGQKDFDEKARLVLEEVERVCDGLESISRGNPEKLWEKWGFSKEWIADDTYLRYYIGLDSFDAKKYLDLTISKLSV